MNNQVAALNSGARGLAPKSPGHLYRSGGVGAQQRMRRFLFKGISSCNQVTDPERNMDFEAGCLLLVSKENKQGSRYANKKQ